MTENPLGDYADKLLYNKMQEQQNRKDLYDILPEHTRKVIDGFMLVKDVLDQVNVAKELYEAQQKARSVRSHYSQRPFLNEELPTAEPTCCPELPPYEIFVNPIKPNKRQAEVICGMGLSTEEERKQAHAEGVPYAMRRITWEERQANRDSLFAIEPDRELVDAMLLKEQSHG